MINSKTHESLMFCWASGLEMRSYFIYLTLSRMLKHYHLYTTLSIVMLICRVHSFLCLSSPWSICITNSYREYLLVENSCKCTLIYLGMKLLDHVEGSASKDNFIRLSIVFKDICTSPAGCENSYCLIYLVLTSTQWPQSFSVYLSFSDHWWCWAFFSCLSVR